MRVQRSRARLDSIFFLIWVHPRFSQKHRASHFLSYFPPHLPRSDLFSGYCFVFLFSCFACPEPLFWGNARLVCLTGDPPLSCPSSILHPAAVCVTNGTRAQFFCPHKPRTRPVSFTFQSQTLGQTGLKKKGDFFILPVRLRISLPSEDSFSCYPSWSVLAGSFSLAFKPQPPNR